MRQSELFSRVSRTAPKDEESVNAQLLIRAGFIDKLMAGVYTYLPLGWRVLNKIEDIVREEMNKAGGMEMLMPALHPKELWQKTGRWDSFDALFKLESKHGTSYALGSTHEEVLYSLLLNHVSSYRDLPIYAYQIQTKFRDEPRAKSGLLRGREFRMKDLYSFHADENDRDRYYEVMRNAYHAIFKRIGLDAIETFASGGTFSEYSHEFQVRSQAGEDSIFVCPTCHIALNQEFIQKERAECPECKQSLERSESAVEVGNIFPLRDRFAEDFKLTFKNEKGKDQLVSVGCYGLGTSRVMGTVVEVFHDEKGILWPDAIAPFPAHLLAISEKGKEKSEVLYKDLQTRGVAVFYDDRENVTAGEKFTDADLIGIPLRAVVSDKTGEKIEVKRRNELEAKLVTKKEFMQMVV